MVKQVPAYQAEDGKIFATEREAAEHDAYTKLIALNVFNHASAMALISGPVDVVLALVPLLDEQGFEQLRRNIFPKG